MSDTLTREETSAREEARSNLPTPERMAKGDIVTHGRAEWEPDIANERATIPTASARRSADPLVRLVMKRFITNDEMSVCRWFRIYWASWKYPRENLVANYDKEVIDGREWKDINPSRMTDACRYRFIALRLQTESNRWLHELICHERSFTEARRVVGGNKNTARKRLRFAIEDLDKQSDILERYELGE